MRINNNSVMKKENEKNIGNMFIWLFVWILRNKSTTEYEERK